jgi:hypothetical protein
LRMKSPPWPGDPYESAASLKQTLALERACGIVVHKDLKKIGRRTS